MITVLVLRGCVSLQSNVSTMVMKAENIDINSKEMKRLVNKKLQQIRKGI